MEENFLKINKQEKAAAAIFHPVATVHSNFLFIHANSEKPHLASNFYSNKQTNNRFTAFPVRENTRSQLAAESQEKYHEAIAVQVQTTR